MAVVLELMPLPLATAGGCSPKPNPAAGRVVLGAAGEAATLVWLGPKLKAGARALTDPAAAPAGAPNWKLAAPAAGCAPTALLPPGGGKPAAAAGALAATDVSTAPLAPPKLKLAGVLAARLTPAPVFVSAAGSETTTGVELLEPDFGAGVGCGRAGVGTCCWARPGTGAALL